MPTSSRAGVYRGNPDEAKEQVKNGRSIPGINILGLGRVLNTYGRLSILLIQSVARVADNLN
jgi:predicted amino acid racemase